MAKWFVQSNGELVGPMTVGELRLLAATGRLQPMDRVRKDSISRWTRAKSVRGLFAPQPEEAGVTAGGAGRYRSSSAWVRANSSAPSPLASRSRSSPRA